MRLLAPEFLSSFFCYVLDEAQQVLCKNFGCNEVFKWRIEPHRHMKTCPHQKPNKGYIIKDGKYICGKCSKHIKHQSNIPRHLKTCKQKVKNTSYDCISYVKKPLSFHVALRSTWHFMENKLKKLALIVKKFLNLLTVIKLTG